MNSVLPRLVWIGGVFGLCGGAWGQAGDVNEDGFVDSLDRDAVISHLLEIAPLSGTALANADANEDGIVDIRDVTFIIRSVVDTDMDGLPDDLEIALGLDPLLADTDGDGTPDGDEDADGDGLTNIEEILNGTDPLAFDSDGDGFSDFDEVSLSSDPNDAQDIPIFDVRSRGLSFNFFDVEKYRTSSGTQLSAQVSYRFVDFEAMSAAASVFSQPLSYAFQDFEANLGTGYFVLSQGVSYSF